MHLVNCFLFERRGKIQNTLPKGLKKSPCSCSCNDFVIYLYVAMLLSLSCIKLVVGHAPAEGSHHWCYVVCMHFNSSLQTLDVTESEGYMIPLNIRNQRVT